MKHKKEKGFWYEFRMFISKGNVIGTAIGIVIGAAFGAIITSLVKDIIMPAIGCLIDGVTLSDFKLVLKKAVIDSDGITIIKPEVALLYGQFIQKIVEFFLIALSIFICIRISVHLLRKNKEQTPPPPPAIDEKLEVLKSIQKLLEQKQDK